ncbi:Ig-like domain-containing protein [Lachnotalea glycerini]|uniref:Ig-like domain-containing protein n=1 Tax=Lachnotalea glycerini TaxID=1763509 RepID=UPI00241CB1A3|nr:Ig-like domain-containing protein [Lachnotalea glycerini]
MYYLSLKVGTTATMQAVISPAIAIDTRITWSSSDNQVAVVDTNGLIIITKVGRYLIIFFLK